MIAIRELTGKLPIGVGVGGRARRLVFQGLDPLLRHVAQEQRVDTPIGTLEIDWDHAPERMLSYLFHNVYRYYESSELGRYIRTLDRRGSMFVDVGANLGMYSLIARASGMSATLVEPEPRHSAFLTRNRAMFGNIEAVALSDEPGDLPLYYERDNPGATSLFAAPGYKKGHGSVPVRTFSTLAADGCFGDPDAIALIKIDVEGLETKVVAGMESFLEAGCRPHIWCEVRGDASGRNGGSYRDVREALAKAGYVAFDVQKGGGAAPQEKGLSRRGVFDLLFRPA